MNRGQSLGGGAPGFLPLKVKKLTPLQTDQNNVIMNNKYSKNEVSMRKKFAFTLAEVLITLGIIGVVAAMTMPVLVEKYQKTETVSRLQKVYNILNNAMRLAEAEYSEYEYWDDPVVIGIEAYYQKYFKPYYKILKECNTYQDCGFDSNFPYKNLDDSQWGEALIWEGRRKAFITSDGMIINIIASGGAPVVKVDRITVDINGAAKPNKLGRDVFRFEGVPKKGVLPMFYDAEEDIVKEECSMSGPRGSSCAAKIMRDGWKIADDYPW